MAKDHSGSRDLLDEERIKISILLFIFLKSNIEKGELTKTPLSVGPTKTSYGLFLLIENV